MSELLGSMLLGAKVLTQEQLNKALARQRSFGGRLATSCLNLGYAEERTLAVLLSRQIGVPFVVLSQSAIPVALTRELPHGAASKLYALPLHRGRTSLQIALGNPKDITSLDQLRFGTGGRLVEHGALLGPLHTAIQDIYQLAKAQSGGFYQGSQVDSAQMDPSQGHIEVVTGDELLVPHAQLTPASTPVADLKYGIDLEQEWDTKVVSQLNPSQSKANTALVVDDEADIRQMITEYLRHQGFTTREAADGRLALQMLQQELPDVVILDAMLPGVHGFDICRRVKSSEATSHIPVIMISAIYRGWRYADDVQRMYGANAFLEKPFDLEELKRELDKCLKGGAAIAASDQPDSRAQSLLQLAAESYRQGNSEQAVAYIEQAVTLAPFSVDLQLRRALLYEKLDQPYSAIAARERIAELEPSYQNLVSLAQVYEKAGFTHKAFEAWERCYWLCEDKTRAQQIKQHMNQLLPG